MAKDQMSNGLVVIGGSSGSLEVMLTIFSGLTQAFPLPVLVVLHRGQNQETALDHVLGSRTQLPVSEAEEKDPLLPGHVYYAPSDYHVLVEADNTLSLDYSEKINFSRPSIDVSFLSAAETLGTGVIAILLSGANEDGAAGMAGIKSKGGYCIVQDPADAVVEYMPRQALRRMIPDEILPGKAIATALIWLTAQR